MPATIDPVWLDFIEEMSGRTDEHWIFRGEGKKTWELRPKAGRPEVCGRAGYRELDEGNLFKDFRREAQRYERGRGVSDIEWLALAQHHGLPTRLLDWTFNPLIAAWFAVEQETDDGRIHQIRARRSDILSAVEPYPLKSPGAPVPSPTLVRVPPLAARITSQQGLFSLHFDPTAQWTPGAPTYQYETFDVPATSKPFFKEVLNLLGVNSSRLMSDLDGLAKTLQWQYRNRS
jgi:hypothetical protein